jgi:single-strand DNA-binding protein
MSINKALIMGHLGRDPDIRYTNTGTAVCTLSIATTEKHKAADGSVKETTEWHKVIVWQKQAENCHKYLKKGSMAYVEGRIQTRSWEDNTGQKRYSTEIIAQSVQFIGKPAGVSAPSEQAVPPDLGPEPSYNSLDDIPF